MPVTDDEEVFTTGDDSNPNISFTNEESSGKGTLNADPLSYLAGKREDASSNENQGVELRALIKDAERFYNELKEVSKILIGNVEREIGRCDIQRVTNIGDGILMGYASTFIAEPLKNLKNLK